MSIPGASDACGCGRRPLRGPPPDRRTGTMTLRGWRAGGAAFLAGALAALAMPPLYWLPLAVVGIVAFVWLWQTAPGPRSALLRGWAWGTGHFAVGSYWIVEAFFVPPPTTPGSACRSWPAWRCFSVSSRALRPVSHAGWSSVGRCWVAAIVA